jgi:hypothetical protein
MTGLSGTCLASQFNLVLLPRSIDGIALRLSSASSPSYSRMAAW